MRFGVGLAFARARFGTNPMRDLNPSRGDEHLVYADLTRTIIGCAMRVHRALGPGFLESVYERALVHELRMAGLRVEAQKPLDVVYEGRIVGVFVADVVIEGRIVVENKASASIAREHEAQLTHYLVATGLDVGLILNFGARSLQFKRKHRTPFVRDPDATSET